MLVNGEKAEYEANITIAELLQNLKLDADMVVVEVDKDIISKDEYSVKKLNSASEVEIIRFVGGG